MTPNKRNKVYHRRYILEFKGVTSNNFMVKFLDSILSGLVEQIRQEYKQVEIAEITVEDMQRLPAEEFGVIRGNGFDVSGDLVAAYCSLREYFSGENKTT